MQEGKVLLDYPPKPVNSTWWRRRDADTFRYYVYKTPFQKKGFAIWYYYCGCQMGLST